MATFTMSLKEVIDRTGGTIEIVDGIAQLTNGNIGLSHYPIFKAEYKPQLDGRIIDHFWNREIGLETISMFQLAMRRKMNLIMPYYNKLYESERIEYDPLSTVDLTRIVADTVSQDTTTSGENESTNNADSGSRTVSSETPQTMLSGSGDYATAATDVTGSTTGGSSGTEENTVASDTESNSDSHTTGYQGVPSELLQSYRQALINVDMMILNELEELFMGIWDTADSYTNSNHLGGYYL